MKRVKRNPVLVRARNDAHLAAGNIDSARCLLAGLIVEQVAQKLTDPERALLQAIDRVLDGAQRNADSAATRLDSQIP